jgi:Iap family predicted aminopeptidase
VALNLTSSKDLVNFKGKLKGAVVLSRPPTKLGLADDIDKQAIAKKEPSPEPSTPRAADEQRRYIRELADFLVAEGAAAIFTDSAKHYGLLVTTGGWMGKDRPSAGNRLPQLFVAHNHYEMLYRLANRPPPAQTRIELEVRNEFIPGPLAVNNTIGEIRGSEKPDEFVICGAHLDSWDLGQGATDNGTGAVVVLEAARLLSKSEAKPRRTIRFILFTGEEQGLHGSKAYVERHKDELEHISACLVDDTGTGKIVGVDARHRPVLQPLLAKELAGLKELDVVSFDSAFISGSDHASFDRVGVPGLLFRQDVAGYRLNHHTQIDTPDRAIEANLAQAAQVMAISALHIANLDALLPRDKPAFKKDRPRDGKKE